MPALQYVLFSHRTVRLGDPPVRADYVHVDPGTTTDRRTPRRSSVFRSPRLGG